VRGLVGEELLHECRIVVVQSLYVIFRLQISSKLYVQEGLCSFALSVMMPYCVEDYGEGEY
jgi:hypothetical protein